MKKLGKLIEFLANLTPFQTLVAMILVSTFYYINYYDSGKTIIYKIDKLSENLKEEEAKKKKVDAALKREVDTKKKIGLLREKYEQMYKKLPTELASSDVLRSLQSLSKASGVKIKSLEPKARVNQEIIELEPINISIEGTFSEITKFMYYISTFDRIMMFSNYRISFNKIDTRGKVKLVLDGVINNYRFIGEQVVAKQEAKKK
jgi:Tfp pilus assembly protein PilO